MNKLRGYTFCRGLLTLAAVVLMVACASQARPPILASAAPLEYPAVAQAQQIEGSVTLQYDIDESGQVSNLRVIEADPPGVFEEAAIASLSAWRFNPARRGGVAVASYNRVSTLTFRLGERDEYNRD